MVLHYVAVQYALSPSDAQDMLVNIHSTAKAQQLCVSLHQISEVIYWAGKSNHLISSCL